MPSDISDVGTLSRARSYLNCASPVYDPKMAAGLLEELSDRGDAEAQYLYSLFLYTGTSVAEDRSTARNILIQSAASGNEDSALMLKEIDANGEGDAVKELFALKLRGE